MRRYPSNFNESRIKAPAWAGQVMSGAFRCRKVCHAPGAGCGGTEFALEGADPACNRRGRGEVCLARIVADGIFGMHQGVLVGGVFLVDIHRLSPACAGLPGPNHGRFPDQSTIAATRRRSSRVESMAEKVGCRSMDWLPAEFLRGEIVWRLAAPLFI